MSMQLSRSGSAHADPAVKEELFWALAEGLLAEAPITRSTMMGFPCLRFDGRFFASIDRDSKDLVVKLPAERVDELIASGRGMVFAPNHRVFREWVAVPAPDRDLWAALLEEARAFATEIAGAKRRPIT